MSSDFLQIPIHQHSIGSDPKTLVELADGTVFSVSYERVSLAPNYEVVPEWPQCPPKIRWGHMPGITADKKDNVWIYPIDMSKRLDGTPTLRYPPRVA